MNMNRKPKPFVRSLLFLLWVSLLTASFAVRDFAQEKKRNPFNPQIVLEISQPPSPATNGPDENPNKQLTYYLKIAALMDEKNREKPFTLWGNQVKGKIAHWLEAASAIENQTCAKQYLNELARNIREQGRFMVELPSWLSIEPVPVEIIFPRAERYSAAMKVLQTYFNIPAAPAGSEMWGNGHFWDAVVYVNEPALTLKFEEYTGIFSLMQDHLYSLPALANSRQEISFMPVIPSFKISQLCFTTRPEIKGGILLYPDIIAESLDPTITKYKSESEDNFIIIVFKNLVDAYFEGVLKPISACVSTGEQVWGLDADIYLSNLIMRRIAHHLGPVFVITPKGEDSARKGGKSQSKEQKPAKEMELKTVSELLGDLFPVLESIKSQAVAIHSTPVLISSGLLPDDKAAKVYFTYLVTLLDQLRNTPREMNLPQQSGKKSWEELLGDPDKENYLAALIQFNYLLSEESIILNIGNHTLDVEREKFAAAVGKLTGEVVRMMIYPNYDSARWFIEKNSVLPPYLKEILKSVEDIPYRVQFHLEKPALMKEEGEDKK